MDPDAVSMRPLILVAEDDSEIRTVLEMVLADANYRVLTAADGVEALDVVFREHPDVILLDVGMPRLDGAGFCRAYRADGGSAPVVLVSAGDPTVIAETAQACGAAAVIAKPFEIDCVLVTVERLVGQGRVAAEPPASTRACCPPGA